VKSAPLNRKWIYLFLSSWAHKRQPKTAIPTYRFSSKFNFQINFSTPLNMARCVASNSAFIGKRFMIWTLNASKRPLHERPYVMFSTKVTQHLGSLCRRHPSSHSSTCILNIKWSFLLPTITTVLAQASLPHHKLVHESRGRYWLCNSKQATQISVTTAFMPIFVIIYPAILN
jgi:hypothetical protein